MKNNISIKGILYALVSCLIVIAPLIISSYLDNISGIPKNEILFTGNLMDLGVTNKLVDTRSDSGAMSYSPRLKSFTPVDPIIIWFGLKRGADNIHSNIDFVAHWVMPNGETKDVNFSSNGTWIYFKLVKENDTIQIGSHYVIVRRLDRNIDLFKINFNVKEPE